MTGASAHLSLACRGIMPHHGAAVHGDVSQALQSIARASESTDPETACGLLEAAITSLGDARGQIEKEIP